MFWRCAREFALDPAALLEMPIRLFWSMSRHIDRLRAEQDLRDLNVALCAAVTAQGDQQFLNELRGSLIEQMGTVMRQREVVSDKADIRKLMEFANKG